ncbi:non-cyanogenic beta-glucosidase, partial [Genlisea aurea]
EAVEADLPRFSPLESTLVKGSFDFIGINHYKTFYVSENTSHATHPDAQADSGSISSATPPDNLPAEVDVKTRRFPICIQMVCGS